MATQAVQGQLVDPSGNLIKSAERQQAEAQQMQMAEALGRYRTEQLKLFQERRMIRAKFDAAQTFSGNENHWSNADNLDPHLVASLSVRRRLRSRSRYELIENNPYLKGTVLSIVNDFVGCGPSLIITDDKLSEKRRQSIQDRWQEWAYACNLREKLWRMRMAKIVDGETFCIPFSNKSRYNNYPIQLDFHVIECDRVSSNEITGVDSRNSVGEIDGLRFDEYEIPISYKILYQHPGGSGQAYPQSIGVTGTDDGKWIPAKFVIHWFRKDRGWLRGIPETTPSLPLCALLRRYTLSIVRHAEVVSDITVLLETGNPASPNAFANPTPSTDEPFDLFPIEMGMMMNLPFGYQMKQLEPVPLGTQYDEFVGSILREICRPLLAPYNLVAGTSKDSNMASAVVDQNIYKGGQESERFSCDHTVLEHMSLLWWNEASLVDNYFDADIKDMIGGTFRRQLPRHEWRWPKIGLDHTDPSKIATSLQILHDKAFMLDADIQKLYFNRDYDTWLKQVTVENQNRQKLKPMNPEDNPENMPKPAVRPAANGKPANGKPVSSSK